MITKNDSKTKLPEIIKNVSNKSIKIDDSLSTSKNIDKYRISKYKERD